MIDIISVEIKRFMPIFICRRRKSCHHGCVFKCKPRLKYAFSDFDITCQSLCNEFIYLILSSHLYLSTKSEVQENIVPFLYYSLFLLIFRHKQSKTKDGRSERERDTIVSIMVHEISTIHFFYFLHSPLPQAILIAAITATNIG